MTTKEEFKYGLNNLNDYCLLNILSFLDIKNKLKLHLTCKRFNELVKNWFYYQKALGDNQSFQVPICTKKEHKINEYQYSLRPITENLPLYNWNLNIMLLNRTFELTKNLECLHFNCLDDESTISDKLILSILNNLNNLTCLSFGFGLQITSKSWNFIISQFGPQLKYLQVNRVNFLVLQNIVKNCIKLETLYIRFCPYSVKCISFLNPNIKKLRLSSLSTIYLNNNMFNRTNTQTNIIEDEEDEDLSVFLINSFNLFNNENENRDQPSTSRANVISRVLSPRPSNITQISSITDSSSTMSILENPKNYWHLNLVELRLNKITAQSLNVIFNNCINLKVLDIVLLFNRISRLFENEDFIQLSYRLQKIKLFALDVCCKWNIVKLDKGLRLIFEEWSKLEVLIIKRGLISEKLFENMKNFNNLKVLSIEFCDKIPFNHRLKEITDQFAKTLNNFQQLEKLRIHFTGLSDKGVIEIIDNCKKLKYLDLYGCLKITNKSLEKICEKLEFLNECDSKKINLFYDSLKNNESCQFFDQITSNCIVCGKSQFTFYLSMNKTKIKLNNFEIPKTLFVVKEDDSIWNSYNYNCY